MIAGLALPAPALGIATVHDLDLAWALAAATHDRLDAAERNAAYVEVGGGDTETAIRRLTSVAVREQVGMTPQLADALRAWWAARNGAETFGNLYVILSREKRDASVIAPPRQASLLILRQFKRLGSPPASNRMTP